MRRLFFLVPVVGSVVLDQISKHWCMTHLNPNVSVPFLDHWLFLTLTYNPRGAFSLLGLPNCVFIAIVSVLIIALVYYVVRSASSLGIQCIVGLIIGGGFGNLIDRVRLGSVVDFLDLRFWPVFNVADSAVSVGMFLFVVSTLRKPLITEEKASL